jgi:uncharacterized membrane protein YozB (DUF420 family)
MPSRDWDDSWYDDDEFPPVRKDRGRSAVVTVAVITFIMCGFNALSATCLLPCGLFIGFFAGHGGGPPLPADLLQHAPLLMVAFGTASAISFVMQIIAGIGLVNNRRWARSISFYLAAYSTLTAFFLLYLTVDIFSSQAGNQGDVIFQAMMSIFGLVFHTGYSLIVFVVLLNGRVAATLR